MTNSRRKGKAGERELIKFLEMRLGTTLTRNLDQSRNGGHDLINVDPIEPIDQVIDRYAIEVKRYKSLHPYKIKKWWTQATTQASKVNKIPMLCYRVDRHDWCICIPADHFVPDELEPLLKHIVRIDIDYE